jgi:hypothetical protein
MRLPRWLLVTLIVVSAVALVAVPAWLWVEMPRRTAEKFVAVVEAGDIQAAQRMLRTNNSTLSLSPENDIFVSYENGSRHYRIEPSELGLERRTVRDLYAGRQRTVGRKVFFDGEVSVWWFSASAQDIVASPD